MTKTALAYDNVGIIASTLCMIHCIGTPFIFIAKACSATCCSEAPLWWIMITIYFCLFLYSYLFYK